MAVKAADFVKKTGKTDGKSNRLGGGGRFKQMEKQGKSDKLIAWIGDRRHGKKEMGKMAAAGRKRAENGKE